MIEISVSNLVKEFEVGNKILDGLTFQVDTGERVGLLGPNGCGKTTLLRILTGVMDYDEGEVVIALEYETAMSFSEGLAAVTKRDKFGYINKENTVVIPFEYDAATAFILGEAKVKKDGKWGTIFPDGTVKWI